MPSKRFPIKTTAWWLREISYRVAMPVTQVRIYSGSSYPVCPRCNIGLEREYVSFCDRCGQRLEWHLVKFVD